MQIELRAIETDQLLELWAVDSLEGVPQPGGWLTCGDRSYLILQRRHRYRLRAGRYELSTVALQVKPQHRPVDARWWGNGWVIGDPGCRFNARSPLLRCAVLPEGPCERCAHHTAAPGLRG